jgi:hypothetical protein
MIRETLLLGSTIEKENHVSWICHDRCPHERT